MAPPYTKEKIVNIFQPMDSRSHFILFSGIVFERKRSFLRKRNNLRLRIRF